MEADIQPTNWIEHHELVFAVEDQTRALIGHFVHDHFGVPVAVPYLLLGGCVFVWAIVGACAKDRNTQAAKVKEFIAFLCTFS